MELIGAFLSGVVGPILYLFIEKYYSKQKEKKKDKIRESIADTCIIDQELESIKLQYDADRVWVSQFHNGGNFYPTGKSIQKFYIFYEVLNPNIESVKNIYQNIPVSLFNTPLSELYEHGEVIIEDAEAANSYLLNTTTGGKCKSIYLLALTDLDGRIIGVMGIHYIEKKHKIVKDEWIFIRQKVGAIGNIISNYLHSKK